MAAEYDRNNPSWYCEEYFKKKNNPRQLGQDEAFDEAIIGGSHDDEFAHAGKRQLQKAEGSDNGMCDNKDKIAFQMGVYGRFGGFKIPDYMGVGQHGLNGLTIIDPIATPLLQPLNAKVNCIDRWLPTLNDATQTPDQITPQ